MKPALLHLPPFQEPHYVVTLTVAVACEPALSDEVGTIDVSRATTSAVALFTPSWTDWLMRGMRWPLLRRRFVH
jgi:hypothetical protein